MGKIVFTSGGPGHDHGPWVPYYMSTKLTSIQRRCSMGQSFLRRSVSMRLLGRAAELVTRSPLSCDVATYGVGAELGSGRLTPSLPSSAAAVGMETSSPHAGSQFGPTTVRHTVTYRGELLRASSPDEVSEMAASSQGSNEGKCESLDLKDFAKKQPWWRALFGQEPGPLVERHSVATQLLIGGLTGWCTGFIFQKVGKLAATAVGGGFFLLQLANHIGYIKVDWQQIEKDVKKAKEQLNIHKSTEMSTEMRSKAVELVSFVKKNVLMTGGFFGGFLLGMAS